MPGPTLLLLLFFPTHQHSIIMCGQAKHSESMHFVAFDILGWEVIPDLVQHDGIRFRIFGI